MHNFYLVEGKTKDSVVICPKTSPFKTASHLSPTKYNRSKFWECKKSRWRRLRSFIYLLKQIVAKFYFWQWVNLSELFWNEVYYILHNHRHHIYYHLQVDHLCQKIINFIRQKHVLKIQLTTSKAKTDRGILCKSQSNAEWHISRKK